MNPLIQAMIELQDALRAIAEAERREAQVPLRQQALDRALQDAAQGLNAAREDLAHAQKERRRLEMEVGSVETLINRHQDQLLSVKSNEAYRTLQHEIEQERAKVRGLEDQILDLMEHADTLTQRIRALEGEHGAERVRVEEEKRKVQEEGAAATRERERLSGLRAGLEQRLPRETLEAFQRIARMRGGVAIVRAQGELCGGCNVRVRPQVFQELRRGDTLFTCDSCKRFLYVEERPPGEARPQGDGQSQGDAQPRNEARPENDAQPPVEEGRAPAGG